MFNDDKGNTIFGISKGFFIFYRKVLFILLIINNLVTIIFENFRTLVIPDFEK